MKYTYNGSELHRKGESVPPVPPTQPAAGQGGVFGLGNLFRRNPVATVSPAIGGVVAANTGTSVPVGAPIPVTAESVVAYLSPSPAEVNQLYGYVVSSPMVVENIRYAQCMAGIPFQYDQTNDVVNAAARRAQSAPDPKNAGRVTLSFDTVIYGGALRYSRLIGIGVAWENAGHRGSLARLIAAMSPQLTAACSVEACFNLITQCDLLTALGDDAVRQKAISYSSGMIVSVLAHEVGHHVLGHLMSFSQRENLEVERNQEREADSFASSVISCSPFSEYTFAGTLFWHYALAVLTDEGTDMHRSHPLSRERFRNFVRNNRAAAAALGIAINE
ncbi:MAG: hypothetical protein IKR48_10560 [Kiritimatiellae bacterium]|nr:hypothetical protein [Kiritimatiellia bacterium]